MYLNIIYNEFNGNSEGCGVCDFYRSVNNHRLPITCIFAVVHVDVQFSILDTRNLVTAYPG